MIGIALLPLFGQMLAELGELRWDVGTASDYAGLEHDVRTAMSGDLLLGTSSRLGVRNLGPFHAYWTLPWYAATGQGAGGMVIAAWALHAIAISTVVLTIDRWLGRTAGLITAIAIAAGWLRAGPAALSDFYNPALTVPAVLIATVAAAAVMSGRWAALPLLIAGISFGVQLHFAAGPGLVLVAAIAIAVGARSGRPSAAISLATAAVVLVLWTPTLIDQLTGTSNAGRFAEAIIAGGPAAEEQPLRAASRAAPRPERAVEAAELLTLVRPEAASQGTLYGSFSLAPLTAVRNVLATVGLLLVCSLAWVVRRRPSPGTAGILLALAGATASTGVTLVYDRGIYPYYLASVPAYGIVLFIFVALAAHDLLRRRQLDTKWIVLPAIAALTVLSMIVPKIEVARVLREGAHPAAQNAFVDHLTNVVPRRCLDNGIAVRAAPEQVADVWTFLVAVDRRHLRATVPKALEPFVGSNHARTGDESVTVVLPTFAEMTARDYPPDAVDAGDCL